jgi:hypothetical protein
VARLASLRPSGGHGRVGWPGERVESGCRWRLLGGGLWNSYSGEQVVRPGQYAGVQALWVWGAALGVLRWQRARTEQGARRWWQKVAAAGLGASREKGLRGGFYSRAWVVRRCTTDRLTPHHGMGRGVAQTGPRRVAMPWPMASGGRRARPMDERHVDCPEIPLTSCTGANARGARTPGRGPASACVYGAVRWRPTWRRRRSAGDVAHAGAANTV